MQLVETIPDPQKLNTSLTPDVTKTPDYLLCGVDKLSLQIL